VARKLGTTALGLFAHRDYLARYGTPVTLDDVGAHSIIGYDRENAFERVLRERGIPLSRDMLALRVDNDLARLNALRAGFGIGICQLGVARRDPNLVHLLPKAFRIELPLWLAMHKDLRAVRRMRLLFDHLAAEIGAYARSSQ